MVLLSLLFALSTCVFGQFELSDIQCSNLKGDEDSKRAIELSDGGWLWAGDIQSEKLGLQIGVIRYDRDLNELWSNEYGGDQYDFAQGLLDWGDGTFWLAGYTTSYGKGRRECYILHIDGDGNLIDDFVYGTRGDDAATFIQKFGNDQLLVGGLSYGDVGNNPQNYFLIINTKGEVQREIIFGDRGAESLWTAHQMEDGSGWMAVGQTTTTVNGEKDFYVVRMDESANVLWENQYGGLGDDRAFAIKRLNDQFIISGFSTTNSPGIRNGYVISIDGTGQLNWERFLPYAQDMELLGITTHYEKILLTGYAFSNQTGDDVILVELSSQGEIGDVYTLDAALEQRGRDIFIRDNTIQVFGHSFCANDEDLSLFSFNWPTLSAFSNTRARLKIGPNPTSNEVLITGATGDLSWLIYDTFGRVISSGASPVIDIRKYSHGLYYLTVSEGSRMHHFSILKTTGIN